MRNPCEDLSNRTISSVDDLEEGWKIVQVLNATGREEVNPKILLDPPLIHIPTPPIQLNAEVMETTVSIERTFFDEISIDFDADAQKAGYSITRNRFSSISNTSSISSNNNNNNIFGLEGEVADGEDSGNVLRGAVSILKLAKSATPLRGRNDRQKNFEAGLRNAVQARLLKQTAPPADRFFRKDLLYAAELFERILDFEGDDSNGGLETGSDHLQKEAENWMEMPTLLGLVEKHSLPDIDHSERTVLDTEFNFGLPASSFEFQRVERTIEQWRDMRVLKRQQRRRRRTTMQKVNEVSEIFGNLERFLESSEDFVRNRMKLHRSFLMESFVEAEELVQKQYVISQFLICPMRTGNCSDCPLDPLLERPQLADWKGGSGSSMRLSRQPRPIRG